MPILWEEFRILGKKILIHCNNMLYDFVWLDNRIEIGLSPISVMKRFSLVERDSSFVAGKFFWNGENKPLIKVSFGPIGDVPTSNELAYLCLRELTRHSLEEGTKVYVTRVSKSSEDTEPAYNLSFLNEPHEELYPCLFRGGTIIPRNVTKVIKHYVLDEIRKSFDSPEKWIYFTIFGSGISYNWDEDGDLDVQMWINAAEYNKISKEKIPPDDLVSEVRRIIQPINFPSFRELGLNTDECDGKMLIQYYPKLGTGSKEENIASQPYACYDMQTNTWIVMPEPIEPKFFADHFILLGPKATEIAKQSESMLESLTRNVIDWHFWTHMADKYKSQRYRERANEAMKDASRDKRGIVSLFNNVFRGRSEAYSPQGKGIKDERDLIQKILEVWGIFQRLKHHARMPLPWEKQDVPMERTSAWKDIMEKARRLRRSGQVHILRNGWNHIVGRVQGDYGIYTSQIWRDDPNSRSITMWDCTCPWDQFAWQRTRKWKKYEGRPCSHVLALFWEAQSHPLDEDRSEVAQEQERPNIPKEVPYGGLQQPPSAVTPSTPATFTPQSPSRPGVVPQQNTNPRTNPLRAWMQQFISPVAPAAVVAPNQSLPSPTRRMPPTSKPVPPGKEGLISIPGAFSSVRVSKFENGQIVRTRKPVEGIDRDGVKWKINRNRKGEVISDDGETAVVIFPLKTGPLQPHIVRVVAPSSWFSPTTGSPFIKRHL